MAKPGEYIIISQSPVSVDGYTEPSPVCWAPNPENETVVSEAEIPSAATEKPIAGTAVDVNGDQLPDQFSLVQTNDKFLLLLSRGVIRSGSWENCGGGSYTEKGFEPKPAVVGVILKSSKNNLRVQSLLWRSDSKDKKPSDLVLEVRGEFSDPVRKGNRLQQIWSFRTMPCPTPDPEFYFRNNCP